MTHLLPQEIVARLRSRLKRLYPDCVKQSMNRLRMMIGRYGVGYDLAPTKEARPAGAKTPPSLWNEKDAVLITYGDSICSPGKPPLSTLRQFAARHWTRAFSTIHLLPFYPWSSDDGFSVIHYRKVDPALGDWQHVRALKEHFDLMFDWVLNHVSSKSPWFRDYRNCILPYRNFFIEESPNADLSQVVRPRTSPLLTPVATKAGQRHVWTTFSADQVDLNWRHPDVFFEMLDVLFHYIANGARIIRLDAVAFLWKKTDTTCLHLEETHEIIRLLRDILQIADPSVLLLTETNVPQEENIRYFGDGDEAHLVYQFSLPPLLLHGLLKNTAKHLSQWAKSLPKLPSNTAFFNFTASHDGIGVRPLEGILPSKEIDFLCDEIKKRGGLLSYRSQPDGSKSLYEINATYFSALSDVEPKNNRQNEAKFLCSQLVALSLKGIPGVYLHSLTATQNDYPGVEASGMPRRINRKKWDENELEQILQNPQSSSHRIFFHLIELLKRRAICDAFHPDSSQEILDLDDQVFALLRKSTSGNQVFCLFNFTDQTLKLEIRPFVAAEKPRELVSNTEWSRPQSPITLEPYQTLWLLSQT